jgi:CheY-like chemotaxis protein
MMRGPSTLAYRPDETRHGQQQHGGPCGRWRLLMDAFATPASPAAQAVPAAPVTLFYSYAHEDESLRDELQGHLKILERRGLLAPWHDRKIVAGQDWSHEIDANLRSAELVLLLISKDFIGSDYIMGTELHAAMQRHATQQTVVVPIVVRAVDLDPEDASDMPFLKLQGLPTGLRPVTSWPNRDEAWTDVAKGLRATVKGIRDRRVQLPPPVSAAPVRAPAQRGEPNLCAKPQRSNWGWRRWLRPGTPRHKLPDLFGAQAADPVLDNVLAGAAQQIEQARLARHEPPPTESATSIMQAGLRALIDMPEQKRVLWVDDRPDGNRFEAAALAKLQIEVVIATTTAQALRCIDADAEGFDLVISDWERVGEPTQAGLQLLAALRKIGFTAPVVFYHGAFGERRGERAKQATLAGAFGDATRPVELMELVHKALSL